MYTTKYMNLYSLVKDNMYIQRAYITSRQLHTKVMVPTLLDIYKGAY